MIRPKKPESCLCDRRVHVGCTMSIAQRGLQHDAVPGMRLYGKGEQPCWREHTGRRGDNRGEIADVDENVGGKDEVIEHASVRLSV
jgi:hypothetical protein